MRPEALLNALWAGGCLLTLAAMLAARWRSHAPASAPRLTRRLLGLLILSGFLFPVVSANDDGAVWRLRAAEVTTAGAQMAATAAPASPANFWFLFSHLQAQAQHHTRPPVLSVPVAALPLYAFAAPPQPHHHPRGPPLVSSLGLA